MKYCAHCGNEMIDEAVVCVKCGCYSNKNTNEKEIVAKKFCSFCGKQMPGSAVVCLKCGALISEDNQISKTQKKYSPGLVSAIKAFSIIGCVVSAFLWLIPLIWTIPMTITLFNKLNLNEPIGVGFKVCSLLFLSEIAGILLLCLGDPKEKE